MAENYPPLPLPPGITESYLQSHDLKYHILSAGNPKHPLILCLHGFPELAYSWRKIMPAIAAEGYHVIAYDQRGYGRTTGWDTRGFSAVDLNTFTFTKLIRDAVILVYALGYHEVACVIGHDFGAVGASMCGLMRPDLFKSVVTMSHPFKGAPVLPSKATNPHPPSAQKDIHEALACLPEPRKHYKWYYSTASAASDMINPRVNLHEFLRGYFHLKSADWDGNKPHSLEEWSASELEKLPYYYVMPLKSSMPEAVAIDMKSEDSFKVRELGSRWLTDEDLDVYVKEFERNGFQGALNWYRVSTDPGLMKDVELFAGRKLDVPYLFISGKQDWGTFQEPGVVDKQKEVCTKFKDTELVDGAGHWVQQEQPEKVVEIVSKFLKDVNTERMSY
ncbi:epoxide hydrolase protein [Rutstroemia sp. NJR-2017a BBW]|nr:epoxide hydrolase protein [Rutstroemia sp. NJR-2017a BBW]